jgi:hypothetical protein
VVDLLYSCIGIPVMITIYHRCTVGVDDPLIDDIIFDSLWFVPNFFFSCSLHHIALLTLDRFLAITRPLRYSESRITRRAFMLGAIASIWGVNAVWSIGAALGEEGRYCSSDASRTVHNVLIGVFWILPVFVILIMYTGIIHEVFIKKPLIGHPRPRGAVTIFWIILALLVTGFPNSIYTFLHFFDDNGEMFGLSASVQRILSVFTDLLKVTNCFLNPLIYFIRMKPFKTTLLLKFRSKPSENINIISIKM